MKAALILLMMSTISFSQIKKKDSILIIKVKYDRKTKKTTGTVESLKNFKKMDSIITVLRKKNKTVKNNKNINQDEL